MGYFAWVRLLALRGSQATRWRGVPALCSALSYSVRGQAMRYVDKGFGLVLTPMGRRAVAVQVAWLSRPNVTAPPSGGPTLALRCRSTHGDSMWCIAPTVSRCRPPLHSEGARQCDGPGKDINPAATIGTSYLEPQRGRSCLLSLKKELYLRLRYIK